MTCALYFVQNIILSGFDWLTRPMVWRRKAASLAGALRGALAGPFDFNLLLAYTLVEAVRLSSQGTSKHSLDWCLP